MSAVCATYGAWSIEWSGGRLAEVHHMEADHAVHAIEVGDFDWNPPGGGPGRQLDPDAITEASLQRELQAWADEDGAAFREAMCW